MATVSFPAEGKSYASADLEAGKVEIAEGSFITKIKDKAGVEAVLGSMKESFPQWAPVSVLSSMDMVIGKLDHEKIAWLLKRDEVEFVEADGIVTICEKS
mmetsp:Transcript_75826/g.169684  ORF Transcript_75826/g.169684 Transcript_75826/m.169684 type:complete len:100 (-) Transcript_75826:167-466(-)